MFVAAARQRLFNGWSEDEITRELPGIHFLPRSARSRNSEAGKSSSYVKKPSCRICLHLDYELFGPIAFQGTLSTVVAYCDLLDSTKNGCLTCSTLTYAISEFSKPIIKIDQDFLDVLLSSVIFIQLNIDYTINVEVCDEDELSRDRYFSIELYTQPDSSSPWPTLGTSSEVPPQLDLATCIKFIGSQIGSCDKSHNLCRPATPNLPSRVLYIGSGEPPSLVRLMQGLGLKHPYVALSHCWGKGEGILTTTTYTIEERCREITWSSLPKTFQDAISITRALEIEYLWIDSLCIIQDDHLDWQVESVKMADVYSQSYLTIAATASSTSLGGCLFNRWHETLDGHEIPHSISKFHSERTKAPPELKLRYSARGHEYFAGQCPDMGNDALLLTRAWAFQERILSKRIIHFHSEEMIWECQECRSCECGYFDWAKSHLVYDDSFHELVKKAFAKLHLGHGTQEDIYRTWRKLVEMFTALDITEELDRLPAVSGLASCISQRLESLYMAGLWKDDLPRELLWNKRPYQRSQRIRFAEDHYVPTWSWASVVLVSSLWSGLQTGPGPFVPDRTFRATAKDLAWKEIKSSLSIKDASLQITGLAIQCALIHQHDVDSSTPSHVLIFRDEEEYVNLDITCDLDDTGRGDDDTEVLCILIGTSGFESTLLHHRSDSTPFDVQWALVLQGLKSGEYKRIGMSHQDSRKCWFKNAEALNISII